MFSDKVSEYDSVCSLARSPFLPCCICAERSYSNERNVRPSSVCPSVKHVDCEKKLKKHMTKFLYSIKILSSNFLRREMVGGATSST